MVAPRPLEPLVLYLATTPRSASTALVALREERPIKDHQQGTSSPSQAQQPQDGAPEASAGPVAIVPPEAQADPLAGGAPKAKVHQAVAGVADDESLEGRHAQETQDLSNTSYLVERPFYFVSTVIREA